MNQQSVSQPRNSMMREEVKEERKNEGRENVKGDGRFIAG
jgi:hypothetical protein